MPAVVFPAPVGGWNARDPLSAMPPNDAVKMINMVSRGLYVECRAPFVYLGAPATFDRIHSMHPYYGTTNTRLLAGDGTAIKEISTGVPATLGTGFTGDPWQATAFNALLILTGGGTAQSYNGTVLTALVTTGVAPADLWGCNTYKGRVYYWKKNDDSFWYAAVGAYQGALTEFPLDVQLSRGGYLVQMVSMTMDSGAGADDLAAFVFSTGEVLIYQGDNPASASSWALVGKYMIPIPLGIRANIRIGANAIVMTRRGYVNLNAIMRGETGPEGYLSDKISKAVDDLVTTYNTNTPADDQSDAVYCAKLNEVVFIHRNKLTGAVGSVESVGIDALPRYSMDSGTWFLAEPRLIGGELSLHHAIAEYNGGLYIAMRQAVSGVVDLVQYSDGSGSEEISTMVQSAFMQPPQGGAVQITAVSVESSATYALPADRAAGVFVVTDYTEAVQTVTNNGAITSGAITMTPWKQIAKFGRSFSVAWGARLVANFQWYRSRVMTKIANSDR